MTNKVPLSPAFLKNKFMAHYHNPDTSAALSGIATLVALELKVHMHDNRHVLWLIYTCNRIHNDHRSSPVTWEMPGMLYGMIVNAFDQALQDYTKWLAENDPDILEQSIEPEDIYGWLKASCEDMFMQEKDALDFINVGDVMRIFTEVLAEKNMVSMVKAVDTKFAAQLISIAMRSKRKDTLMRVKASIKSNFEAFVEEYAKAHSK